MRLLLIFKFLIILALIPSTPLLAENTHQADGNQSQGGKKKPRESKVWEYFSACMQGRPGFDSIIDDTSNGGGVKALVDSSKFQAKCMTCHAPGGRGPDFSNISSAQATKALTRISLPGTDPKHMPLNGTLTAEEMSSITAFLNSKK